MTTNKTSVAIIAAYGAFLPPGNGGHLRTFHLMRALSASCQITVFSHTPETPEIRRFLNDNTYSPVTLRQTKLPSRAKRSIWIRLLDRIRHANAVKDCLVPSDASVLSLHQAFRDSLSHDVYDVILVESLPPAAFSRFRNKDGKKPMLIYNAHNVDSVLARQAMGKPLPKQHPALRKERKLWKHCDLVFSCSVPDRDSFLRINPKPVQIEVVPNGVDTERNPFDEDREGVRPNRILFCGSLAYRPNEEGLIWFMEKVWPLLQEDHLELCVIGRGTASPALRAALAAPRVELIGEVPSTLPYYREAAIAIVPLLSGSGTRLKILEAMALGTPLVSTSTGAEGIETTPAAISISDHPDGFADAIRRLVKHPDHANDQRMAARSLVEHKYEWKHIGEIAAESIRSKLSKSTF